MKSKFLSLILAFTLVFTMMPMMSGVAYAETTPISILDLTYNPAVLDLNTAWTEGEVSKRVRSNLSTTTTGLKVDPDNSGLVYLNPEKTAWNGISYGTDKVSNTKEYGLKIHLTVSSGYDWVESAKKTTSSEISGLTVNINGVQVTGDCKFGYSATWNEIDVYYGIGMAESTPIVTNISISDNDLSIARGTTHTFTGSVEGTVTNKSIQWSVENATSPGTSINSAGVLTIAVDESASKLKVVATSAADSSKKASVIVELTDGAPYISSVTVSPSSTKLKPRATKQFYVEVVGTQSDKSVTWSVIGNNSPNTTIASNGILTVGTDETATSFTVKAVSNQDLSKYATSTVTVEQLNQVSAIELNYDADVWNVREGCTEGDVDTRVRSNLATSTTGLSVDPKNSGLMRYNTEANAWYGIGEGTDMVSQSTLYGFKCHLELDEDYDWIASAKKTTPSEITGLTVKVNGVDVTSDCTFNYSSYWNQIDVYYGIGPGKAELVTVSFNTSGGTEIPSQTIEKGQKATQPADPTKDGYTFISWVNASGRNFSFDTPIGADTTLYAQWTAVHTHSWDDGVITTPSTCSTEGVKTYTCYCGAFTTEPVPVDPDVHTWDSGVVTIASGLWKNGVKTFTCTECTATKEATISGYCGYYVKSFKLSKGKKYFTAKWKKQSKANRKKFSGYQVEYSLYSSFKDSKKVTASAASKSKKVKGLKAKTYYYVHVRTYKYYGGKYYYSNWSTTKKVKTK